MWKKNLIIGAVFVVIIVGIFVGKAYTNKKESSSLPVEEITTINSDEADTTVDHIYYGN